MMIHLRFLNSALFSARCLSDRLRNVVPNLKPNNECKVWPLILALAAPVKEVRTTYGRLGSSPACWKILDIMAYKEFITLDLPEPAPPWTITRGGDGRAELI